MDIVIYSMAAVLAVLGLYFVVPYYVRNCLRRRFLATVEKHGQVCLTFDDGPNPESTPDLLNLLDELEVKATFFLIGQNIEKYPELCGAIIQRGHEVGDHGHRHIHPWACSPFCAVFDLFRGCLALKKYSHSERPFWLRPPYGKLNLITLCYVLLRRRKLAFWSIDARDYQPQSPEDLSANVLRHFRTGSVILMHERPFHRNKALQGNLDAIRTIVQEIKKRGYAFAKVSEAAEDITQYTPVFSNE